jgi:hypothetical protein
MEATLYRQRDSAAVIMCPRCTVSNWADKEAWEKLQAHKAWAVCPKCGVVCVCAEVPADLPDPITVNDLDRVVISNGLTASQATHKQFDAWARTFIELAKNDNGHWTPEQRAGLCDLLLLQEKITVLPKEEALCNKEH